MNRCCFYGSLRKPMYNYLTCVSVFGKEEMKYIKTIKIPGYRLYKINNSYPAAIESSTSDSIIVDLFEISDSAFDSIERMEKQAGYYEKIINIDDVMYSIFLFSFNQVNHDNFISSGDWTTYINNSNFVKELNNN